MKPGSDADTLSDPTRPRPGVLRQTGLTGIAALVGVASGLLLDVAIAAVHGAGVVTDAYFAASRIPVGIATILMVGVNQTLVPSFSTWLVRDPSGSTRRVSLFLNSALLVACAGPLVLALAADPLTRILAPGFGEQQTALTVSLTRILLLVVPLTLVAEVMRGYLNAHYVVALPAAMTAVLNGVACALIVFGPRGSAMLLGWAYVAGSAARALAMTGLAFSKGWRPVAGLGFRDPEVMAAARLSLWPLASAGLVPVARTAEQILLSYLPVGSITIVNYGYRLVYAIGGTVFFRSIFSTVVPRLSSATARNEINEVRRLTGLGLRILLVVSIPLTAFLAVLGAPAVAVVFRRGNFDAASAQLLGLVLSAFAFALVASAFERGVLAPFYARLEPRIAFFTSLYDVGANLLLLPPLVWLFWGRPEAVVAVAVAHAVSQYVGPVYAWRQLRSRIGKPSLEVRTTLLPLIATTAISVAVMAGMRVVLDLDVTLPRVVLTVRTFAVAACGAAVYVPLAVVLFRTLRRKPGIPPPGPTAP